MQAIKGIYWKKLFRKRSSSWWTFAFKFFPFPQEKYSHPISFHLFGQLSNILGEESANSIYVDTGTGQKIVIG